MELILAIALLIGLLFISDSDFRKRKEDEKSVDYDTILKRSTQVPEIEAWVEDTRRGKDRQKVIAEWQYYKDTADTLLVRFRGEKDFVIGKVHFIYDDGRPRVSRFVWVDKDGVQRHVAGTRLPQIGFSELVESFRMAKKDAGKLRYINKVARLSQQDGNAVFDICEYERITPKVFKETFGKRELKAFCQMLSEEFEILNVNENGQLLVRLAAEPQM